MQYDTMPRHNPVKKKDKDAEGIEKDGW